MSGCWDWLQSPELFPGHRKSCRNGIAAAPSRAQHITEEAESGLHTMHAAVVIDFSHNSAIVRPSLATTPGADIVWVCHQSFSNAIALPVDPNAYIQNIGWYYCQHYYGREHMGIYQISWRQHGQHQRPGTLASSCWHGALYFPCQLSAP